MTAGRKLIEGRDYYLENSLWVFTEKYHIEKGHCCNNRCRHCPYDAKGQLRDDIQKNLSLYLQKIYPSENPHAGS